MKIRALERHQMEARRLRSHYAGSLLVAAVMAIDHAIRRLAHPGR